MYKICFYVPEENLDSVKEAVFAAGGGRIGDYQKCAWQTRGLGQFMAMEDANPHIGEVAKVEQVAEYKVELVCEDDCIKAVIQALIETHPYEEPAYQVLKVESIL